MLTGIKDLDVEILIRMDDIEFILVSGLNKYFVELYKRNRYLIYKKKLERNYPDTLESKKIRRCRRESWKLYYFRVINLKNELNIKYKFDYTTGNIFKQATILKEFPYNIILYQAILNRQLPVIPYAVKNGAIIFKYHLIKALPNIPILKCLIDHGGDVSLLKDEDLTMYEEVRNFLKLKIKMF